MGEFRITAKDPKSKSLHEFMVRSIAYVFDVRWSSSDSLVDNYLQRYPDVLCRGIKYNMNVRLLDHNLNPVGGMPFKVLAMEGLQRLGIDIEGVGEEHISTIAGIDFLMISTPSEELGEIKLGLSGPVTEDPFYVYKIGWLCMPFSATLRPLRLVELMWLPYVSLPGQFVIASDSEFVKVSVDVFSKNWCAEVYAVAKLGIVFAVASFADFAGADLQRGDQVSFDMVISNNRYFIFCFNSLPIS